MTIVHLFPSKNAVASVLTRDFRLSDLRISTRNLRKERDSIVCTDTLSEACTIYEVKHSAATASEQRRWLNEKRCFAFLASKSVSAPWHLCLLRPPHSPIRNMQVSLFIYTRL